MPEVRITDPLTGGQKGQKDVQLSMAPVQFLEDLGRVYAMGAEKYDRDNWKKGYAWHLSYDAALRHLLASARGEWLDAESGLPHVVHVAWHMATLHTFEAQGLGTDDRDVLPVAAPDPDPEPDPDFSSEYRARNQYANGAPGAWTWWSFDRERAAGLVARRRVVGRPHLGVEWERRPVA